MEKNVELTILDLLDLISLLKFDINKHQVYLENLKAKKESLLVKGVSIEINHWKYLLKKLEDALHEE